MDQFGNIGPDEGNYASDVQALATALRDGAAYFGLVARATRLEVLLDQNTWPGGAEGLDDGEWLFAAVRGHGAYWFKVDGYLAPDYVAQKLNVARGDGEALAELLTRVGLVLRTEAEHG